MTEIRHLLDPQDFSVEELEKLFSLAEKNNRRGGRKI